MVFSSVPAYLDPPIWQQQQSGSGGDHDNAHVPPLLPPPPPPDPLITRRGGGSSSTGGSGKPGSTSDRAKLARLTQVTDHVALKCPRCESTNTKFCYFNNYNLSQPRHFCKTCRRYWTRGGALRNVPVGGGCRRNKIRISKSGRRSKSPANMITSSALSLLNTTPNSCSTDNLCGNSTLPLPPKLPFLPSLHHLTSDNGSGDRTGLTFGGIQAATGTTVENDIDLIRIGSSSSYSSNGKFAYDQWTWRMQQLQIPFLEGQFESAYRDQGPSSYAGGSVTCDYLGSSYKTFDSGVLQVVQGVKMEENFQGLNLSKKLLGTTSGTDQNHYSWGNSNAWNTINGSDHFASSSSTGHVL